MRETWRDNVVGKTGVWGLYAGWRDIKPEKLDNAEKKRQEIAEENNTKKRKNWNWNWKKLW